MSLSADAPDAIVVGSGPNGLAAAIRLAEAGKSVRVYEASDTIGGGMRTRELIAPDHRHDLCSAIHPTAVISPYFKSLPLDKYGLEWIFPPVSVAHPLDGGEAAMLSSDLVESCESLGEDGAAHRKLVVPLLRQLDELMPDLLAPLRIPSHPVTMARFGLSAVQSAVGYARRKYRTDAARALFVGNAAHSFLPLERYLTAAMGVILSLGAHRPGWPVAKGGSQAIADALGAHLRALGGEIVTRHPVRSWADLPESSVVMLDMAPHRIADLAEDALPRRYLAALRRFRYGPAVFKLDWVANEAIPWTHAHCRRASTVHVGGTMEEIAAAEAAIWRDEIPERPFTLVSEPTRFDRSRAPIGRHIGWAYCHIPQGCTRDMSGAIVEQIERFAPGFRDTIEHSHAMGPTEYEAYNANFVGGHIIGGVADIAQLFTRPVKRINPYATPNRRLYVCSASTPPGGGVHGMCGYFAAETALRRAWR